MKMPRYSARVKEKFLFNKINKDKLEIVQINLGNKCNQRCSHCHIDASPSGNKNMDEETAKNILRKLIELDVRNIEFTGGAPELNYNLKFFIEKLSKFNKNITVRTNLTVLNLSGYSSYIDFYKNNKVKIIASLPSLFQEITDKQRGDGVFFKSIKVLEKLNKIGYGTNGLYLDIVYNPSSDFLPVSQKQIEEEYKKLLEEKYNLYFNNLITIVNVPIKRFKKFLQKEEKLDDYMNLLKQKFNSETLNNLMCRRLISIDYAGYIHDCDFNLALGKRIKGFDKLKFWEIDSFDNFNPEITFDSYCYACTAEHGSSCYGTLVKEEDFDVKKSVSVYYGEKLKKTSDLKTNACCTDSVPEYMKNVLSLINDEIKMKYYGCGSPIPYFLNGLKVLDVGCGTGKDVYIVSKLVGKNGFVYGIDMTENQINVGKKYINEHSKRFGYKNPNVEFILDYIENIDKYFEKESLDLIISNCVMNLVEDKEHVLNKIYKILKFGAEFNFSDVYTDRRSPEEIKKNPLLYNECLGGALYYKDFERIAKRVGFIDTRIVSKREININNPEIKKLVGNIRFCSITYRLWKLKGLEDACEDYGHIVVYKGGIPESEFKFELDNAHVFYKDKPEKVCGNTILMLSKTRFKKYFKIIGSFKEHFGLFENCSNANFGNKNNSLLESCSCC